jgi:hypothetical protein
MADTAQAYPCPNGCGLVTVSGAYDDPELSGQCANPGCRRSMTVRHIALMQHPLYGRGYYKVGPDPENAQAPSEAAAQPAPGTVTLEGYDVTLSQPVGEQWVAFVPQIDSEPVGAPTRDAALEAVRVKIEKRRQPLQGSATPSTSSTSWFNDEPLA